MLKFSQNTLLRNELLGTLALALAEASPHDSIWGIGISASRAAAGTKWNGLNLLGQVLERVRAHLALDQGDIGDGSEELCCTVCLADKWPKQNMPRVSDLLTAIAILKHAAFILHEPVYIMATNFRNFFNQRKLAPEEYWICGMILSDLAGPTSAAEYIMTFGLRPTSGIAQRVAEAILFIFKPTLYQALQPLANGKLHDHLRAKLGCMNRTSIVMTQPS